MSGRIPLAVAVPLALLITAIGGPVGRPRILAAPPSGSGQTAAVQTAPLWISSTPISDDRQLLVVVDPLERTAAVYHLDVTTGTLTLKSSRSIRWDLMIGEFNAQEPTPSALRKMVEGAAPTRP